MLFVLILTTDPKGNWVAAVPSLSLTLTVKVGIVVFR